MESWQSFSCHQQLTNWHTPWFIIHTCFSKHRVPRQLDGHFRAVDCSHWSRSQKSELSNESNQSAVRFMCHPVYMKQLLFFCYVHKSTKEFVCLRISILCERRTPCETLWLQMSSPLVEQRSWFSLYCWFANLVDAKTPSFNWCSWMGLSVPVSVYPAGNSSTIHVLWALVSLPTQCFAAARQGSRTNVVMSWPTPAITSVRMRGCAH